jgi:nucleoid-associated protein YgaU
MLRMHIIALSLGATVAIAGGAVLIWQGLLPGLPGSKPASLIAHAPAPPAHPAPLAQIPPAPKPNARAVAPQPTVPQFDTVRVEPSGDTVVAGHSEPHAQVSLLAGQKILGNAEADDGGDFVILPQPLAPGNYILVLRSTSGHAASVFSQQSITVSVPEKGQKGVVVALLQPGKPSKLLTDPTAQGAEPQKPHASEKVAAGAQGAGSLQSSGKRMPQTASNETTQKPAFVTTSSDAKAATLAMGEPAAKAVQNAENASASPKPTVAVKTAEVDRGGFYAAGIAPPGTHLRIYLNGSAIADVVADAQGQWSLTVGKGVIAGHYVVRADAVTNKGKVVARAEVPFDVPVAVAQAEQPKPEVKPQAKSDAKSEPKPDVKADIEAKTAANAKADATEAQGDQPKTAADLAAHPEQESNGSSQDASHAVVPSIDTATVTRGDSLWRISRKELGEGIRYTLIYQANASQIRDPNLIYPGQVFVVPHVN